MAESEDGRTRGSSVDLSANTLEVQCGQLVAHMLMDKFICPGIHQQCIEVDGELISPKEFTIRASKDRQKDWKGSIRIGKSNLRALMEMKKLDFHMHENHCSGKCQSRNYITSKNYNEELNVKADPVAGPSTSNSDTPESSQCSNILLAKALQHLVTHNVASANSPQMNFALPYSSFNERFFKLLNQSKHDPMKQEEQISLKVFSSLSAQAMSSHPVRYWDMVKGLDLFNDFVDLVKNSLVQKQETKGEDQKQRHNTAQIFSQIAKMLGVEAEMNDKIYRKRFQLAAEEQSLLSDTRTLNLAELEQKVEENCRKLIEARRKLAHYDDLVFTLTTPPKRSRLSFDDSSLAL